MIFDMSGGGASLNFKVVGGPSKRTKPESPSENMFWVDTELEISKTSMSIDAPENPEHGMLWITTGMHGPIKFSAFKNKCVMVYPKSISQYIDEQWVDVPSEIYHDHRWIELPTEVVVFADGVFNNELIGNTTGTYYITENMISFHKISNQTFSHDKAIDLTRFNRVEFVSAYKMWQGGTAFIRDSSGKDIKSANISNPGIYAIDVSDLQGPYFLRIYSSGNGDDNYFRVSCITLKV